MSRQVRPSLPVRLYCWFATAVTSWPAESGSRVAVRRVGEYGAVEPAPAKMLAPPAGLLAFHCSVIRYVVPAVIGYTVCTNAAFGEKVPAKPPLSFQATMAPLTLMPRSWLMPAVAVQRSALPVTMACALTPGVMVRTRLVASMSGRVAPLVLVTWYWALPTPVYGDEPLCATA